MRKWTNAISMTVRHKREKYTPHWCTYKSPHKAHNDLSAGRPRGNVSLSTVGRNTNIAYSTETRRQSLIRFNSTGPRLTSVPDLAQPTGPRLTSVPDLVQPYRAKTDVSHWSGSTVQGQDVSPWSGSTVQGQDVSPWSGSTVLGQDVSHWSGWKGTRIVFQARSKDQEI